jgi:hypothetical protein
VRPIERLGFGSSNMLIRRDPASGVLSGGADPRSDGCSMGF